MTATTPAPGMTPRRLKRILLLGLLGLVGCALLLVVMLPYVVSLDSIKGHIVAQLEVALQRKLEVGAIRLQLLSGLGAGLEDVIIYNPPGWQHPYCLQAGQLSVKIAWRPLLRRHVEVTRLLLSDGEVILERDAQGRMNFAGLAAAKPASAEALPAPAHRLPQGSSAQASSNPLTGLSVAEMTLQKMRILFIDRRVVPGQDTITAFNNVQFHVRDIALDTPMPLDMLATMATDRSPNIHIRGSVGPIPENLALERIPIDVHLQATGVRLDDLKPYLGANVPLSHGRVGADVAIEGSIDQDLRIKSTLSLADAILDERIPPDVVRALPALTSTQDIAVDLRAGQAELMNVAIDLAGIRATIKGVVHTFTTVPQLDLRLSTNTFTPGTLLTQFPLLASRWPTPTDLRGNVQLQATLQGTPQDLHAEAQLELHDIALRSGAFGGGTPESGGVLLETDMADARLVAHVINAEPPRLYVDLRAQRLTFDRRATPAPVSRTASGPPSEPTPQTPVSRPMWPPVTLSGNVSVAEGRLKGLNFQQMSAAFNFFKGLLKSTQQMTLYRGSYRGTVQVDLTSSEPSYRLDAQFASLDVGQALSALTPAKNVFLGVLNSDMRLAGRGLAWDVMNKTLSGDGNVKITEAQWTTFDLMPKLVPLLRTIGGLAGLTIPNDWEHHAFRTIEGDWRLHQGKILTDHLRLRGDGMEALLKGYVGLDQSVVYAGKVFLPATFIARQGAPTLLRLDDAGRIVVPFMVHGTVTAPQISFDENALMDVAKEELIDTVRKQLGDKVEEGFGKPSASDQQGQQSDQTGDRTGDRPKWQNLPGKILQELFRR